MHRRRRSIIATVVMGMAASSLLLASNAPSSQAAPKPGQLFVVQAVPAEKITIAVDGRNVEQELAVGGVVGPLSLTPGKHKIEMRAAKGGWTVATSVKVTSGSAQDVVLHRPAARGGDPVVSTYDVPDDPIAPTKARVLLAHTATAPPADVRVDNQTVFTNIANGEYAEADVPAGAHTVALLPSGADRGAFLGPLEVTLPAKTVTMVYAVGSPRNNSMRAVSHQEKLASDGSAVPSRIETGSSAGLVRDLVVSPFGAR